MKNKYLLFLFTISILISISVDNVMAQCGVTANASSTNIICGDSVTLTAIPNGCKPLNNDFNNGSVGTWAATPGGLVVNNSNGTYSCMGATPDAPYFFFMGSSSDTPRSVESNALDLNSCPNVGGSACWLMKYSSQGETGTCEGPDANGEGVYLEYNKGGGWVQLAYFDPNGGNDPQLTGWNQHCVTLPAAAITSATKFRWIQKASSGAGFDTWAIDKVQIILNVPGYKYDWLHDAQAANISPVTPNVAPAANTTYTITYSNKSTGGTDTCSATVSVNVTKPQVTVASVNPICAGGTAALLAISPYQSTPPTTCGFATPSSYCNPISEQSVDYKLGTGTTVNAYNSGSVNLFGDFGPTNSNSRMQVLYRAAELATAGLKPGRIRSIAFDIATIEDAGAYTDFSIYIGCTAVNAFASSTSFVPLASMSLVYGGTGKSQNITSGWNQFNFANDFNWTGTNIVIQICWTVASSSVTLSAKTRDHAAGFTAAIQAVNNTFNYSPTVCQSATTFGASATNRPNTIFGNCYPRTVTMDYSWTPTAGLSSAIIKNPNASPATTTTYTVSAFAKPYSQCATTASVPVTLIIPSVSANPLNSTVCPPSPSNVVITATGNTSGTFTGSVPFTNSIVSAVANNTPAGVNSTINVQGISANATSQLSSVCLNITEPRDQDLKVTLTSPGGSVMRLLNNGGGQTGANLTNTCFSATGAALSAAPYTGTFTPNQPFTTLTGVANGLWTLNVSDNSATGAAGSLSNWTMNFNTTANNIVSYQWTPSAGLSATDVAAPTAAPTVTTTYTIKITDALGCTATTTAAVGYCATVPINLSKDLEAAKQDNSVHLTWQTAQEINNHLFIIERSVNGIDFEEIGSIPGKGHSSEITDYSYLDKKPNTGINYYRLKQVDFNGEYSYTNIVGIFFSFNFQNLEMNGLSPIPVVDILSYKLFALYGGEVTVTITDVSGKTIYSEKQNAISGINNFSINVSSLQQGSYILKSAQNGQTDVKRFIK